MRASLRWKMAYVAGALLAASAPAFGQAVPDASSNAPATDAIGPRELQNFSLPGTTTKEAEPPPATAPAARSTPRETVQTERKPDGPGAAPARHAAVREATRQSSAPSSSTETAGQRAVIETQAPASAPSAPLSTQLTVSSPSPAVAPAAAAPDSLAPERRVPLLPWLIAAVVLAAGAVFLFWRRHHPKEAYAGGAEYDLFVPAEAAPGPARPVLARAAAQAAQPASEPLPAPEPAARPVSPPRPKGIVASRLRPSIELAMQPLRCLVDDDQVTIEFEVELFNSGSAPARAVIAEATLFNASASHEQELADFYAKPPVLADPIDSIPPMRRMTFTNRVVAPRAQVQEYELAGRKSFVPVLAFNARYEWSGGKGQSSLAYLLGRETRSEKLGPLHLDGARRELRGLGARLLPTAVRT